MQLTRQSGVHRLNIASSTEKKIQQALKKSLRQASKNFSKQLVTTLYDVKKIHASLRALSYALKLTSV